MPKKQKIKVVVPQIETVHMVGDLKFATLEEANRHIIVSAVKAELAYALNPVTADDSTDLVEFLINNAGPIKDTLAKLPEDCLQPPAKAGRRGRPATKANKAAPVLSITTVTAANAAAPAKRHRRTKAEMEAAKAAEKEAKRAAKLNVTSPDPEEPAPEVAKPTAGKRGRPAGVKNKAKEGEEPSSEASEAPEPAKATSPLFKAPGVPPPYLPPTWNK